MKRNLYYIGLAIVALSAVSSLSSCGGKGDAAAAAAAMRGQAPSLAVQTIQPAAIELQSLYPATIKGKTDIEVRPMISGNITAVHVDEGAHVQKGQLLFTIDQVPYQAAVEQAEASVNVAKTAVETAQISVNSNRALHEKNIISDNAMRISENQLAQAQAQLAQAQAGLTNARKNLSYTQVVAPSSGVVGSIPLRVGALASPSGMALTTVSDNSEVYAYFSLTERQILDLTKGGETSLNAAIAAMPAVKLKLANGAVYGSEGKVATVSGVIDPSTGASTVRALFKNANGVLRSGSTGSIIVPESYTDVIVIPQTATTEVQGNRFVFVLDENNTLHQTPIEVLPNQDGKNFVVTSGLKAGDVIVVQGVGTTARDGVTIQPVDAAAAAQQQSSNQAEQK
ncbi:MAG: efflux RND transporter periplasmic adaptor subunit [Muribaculaceae bacterium]|nr:efflux RND transporter periplasmic adaptor subunit [Muribaculaceae bacterium]